MKTRSRSDNYKRNPDWALGRRHSNQSPALCGVLVSRERGARGSCCDAKISSSIVYAKSETSSLCVCGVHAALQLSMGLWRDHAGRRRTATPLVLDVGSVCGSTVGTWSTWRPGPVTFPPLVPLHARCARARARRKARKENNAFFARATRILAWHPC